MRKNFIVKNLIVKNLIAIMALVLIMGLAACGRSGMKIGEESSYDIGSSYDVTMEIVDGTLTPTSATIRVINNTDLLMISGNVHDFLIEVRQQDKWKEIDIGESENTAEGVGFAGTGEMELDWSKSYGELPAGEYRIVKGFSVDAGSESYDPGENFILAAEFMIQ